MADKVFGQDFNNNTSPAGTSTISVNNGTTLEDVALSDLMKLVQGTNRNSIVNGNMSVAQRATSVASITTSGFYTLDRWRVNVTTLGTWTMSQATDAPATSKSTQSLKMLCTTAKPSPAAGDLITIQYRAEGQLVQNYLKGLAAAKQFSLQFWVKTNAVGTYVVELVDNTNTRGVSATYTVNSSNTWEQKTVTFPADATGAFSNDSNLALIINFWLAAGSNFTSGSLATTWGALVSANRAVGTANVAGAINNAWQITDVQLEPGSTNTEFEFQGFDQVLFRCMRYYQKSFAYATAPAQNAGTVGALAFMAGKAGAAVSYAMLDFFATMRAAPSTVTFYNPSAANAQARDITAAADCSATGVAASTASEKSLAVVETGNASTAVGNLIMVHWTADAEI